MERIIRRSREIKNGLNCYSVVRIYDLANLQSWQKAVKNEETLKIPQIKPDELRGFRNGVRSDGTKPADEGLVEIWHGDWETKWVSEGGLEEKDHLRVDRKVSVS